MRHRDIEIRITCDGQALDDHNLQIEGNVAECYVASQSDKVFEIICSNHSSAQSMVLNVYVDNYEFSKTSIMKPKRLSRSITCKVGRNGIRPMMFSNISVTDDEDAAEEVPWVDDLGLIEIFVGRAKVLHEVPWSPPVGEPHNLGPVHESLKKGGMHCVSFGPTVASPYRRGRAVEMDDIDTWSAPYIIFKFKYRPLAILQAGILQPIVVDPPRDDSPDKLPRSERPCKRPRLDGVSSTIIDLTDDTEDIKSSVPKDEDDDDMEDAAALEAQIQTLRKRLDRKRLRKARRGQSGAVKKEESPTQAYGVPFAAIFAPSQNFAHAPIPEFRTPPSQNFARPHPRISAPATHPTIPVPSIPQFRVGTHPHN